MRAPARTASRSVVALDGCVRVHDQRKSRDAGDFPLRLVLATRMAPPAQSSRSVTRSRTAELGRYPPTAWRTATTQSRLFSSHKALPHCRRSF
jgi:hypothetical protein